MRIINLEIDPGRKAKATLAAKRHLRIVGEQITDGDLPKFMMLPQGGALVLSPGSSREQPVDISLLPILLEQSQR